MNEKNTFILNGNVYGGYSNGSEGFDNTVELNGGKVTGDIYGSYSLLSLNNNVNINSGSLIGNIYGGYTETNSSSENNVNVNGGSITGNVYGGYGAAALNNNINISGNPNLSSTTLFGSNSSNNTGNNLNIYTKNLTANNIYNFNSINFYLPSSTVSGDTILTLTDTNGTDITGTAINAGVQGDSTLDVGDTVTLLRNESGITADKDLELGTLSEGVSLDYKLALVESDGKSIVAEITDAPLVDKGDDNGGDEPGDNASQKTAGGDNGSNESEGTGDNNTNGGNTTGNSGSNPVAKNNGTSMTEKKETKLSTIETEYTPTIIERNVTSHSTGETKTTVQLKPQTKALTQAAVSSLVSIDQGSDRVAGDFSAEANAVAAAAGNSYGAVACLGAANITRKLPSGGKIESKGGGFDLGVARNFSNSHGTLMLAPLVDYGHSKYDSYLPNGLHSHGTSSYWMGGLMARQSNFNGTYYEASFRGGRSKTSFSSEDFTVGNTPVGVSYNTSATCYAGHLRLGRVYQLDRKNNVDIYGIYYHNHMGGSTARLSSGETYQFDSVKSQRVRLGFRVTNQKGKHSRFYSGGAKFEKSF